MHREKHCKTTIFFNTVRKNFGHTTQLYSPVYLLSSKAVLSEQQSNTYSKAAFKLDRISHFILYGDLWDFD